MASPRRLVAVLAACAVGLAACSESREDAENAEAEARAEERAVEAQIAQDDCHALLDGFIVSLNSLDSRLDIGVNYDEYFDLVGKANADYNEIPFKQLSPSCVNNVGLRSENALNAYIRASEAWNECFDALTCGDDISPEVQDAWAEATVQITAAKRGFADVA